MTHVPVDHMTAMSWVRGTARAIRLNGGGNTYHAKGIPYFEA